MKGRVVHISVLIAITLFFSYCFKKLNEDMQDMKSNLCKRTNDAEVVFGPDDPIEVTTTFAGDNGSTREVSGVYRFRSPSHHTQYFYESGDGTYVIYIERFSKVAQNECAWVAFKYNPANKAVTEKKGGHHWRNADVYWDNAIYYDSFTPAPVIHITVNSFDLVTGNISLHFSASADGMYTRSFRNFAPNPGKSMFTKFSFCGKLKLFSRN